MRAAFLSASRAWTAIMITLLATSHASAAGITASTYRLDSYALQLNGESQLVSGLDGGFIDGTVVAQTIGTTLKKHIAGIVIEPVRARVQVDQFTQFLADSLEGKPDGAKGAAYYIDNAGKVQQERDFTGLTLTELAFPLISGISKPTTGTQLTITLAAQSAKAVDVLAGALPPVKPETGAAARTKRWAGGFQFQVPGLPTNRVSTIEAFTLRRKIAPSSEREFQKTQVSPWEIPNLVFYMTPQDSQAWLAWHDDFVVKGNNSEAQEKTFTLDLLAPDMKETIVQLQGIGVGIVSAKYEQPVGAPTTSIQGFRVELYVQSMKLVPGGASQTTAAPPSGPTPQTAVPASRPMRPKLTEIRPPNR